MMTTLFPSLIFLLLLNNLLLLGAPRLPWLIRLIAFQGLLLAGMLACLGHLWLALGVFGIKSLLLPYLLNHTRTHLRSQEELKPRLHVGIEILAGMGGLIFAFWLESQLVILPGLFPDLLLPTAMTTLFCGLILVVGRTTALSQVMGYLVAENGIFLTGMPLMTADGAWFEMALLLDVFVAVFVMGIAIHHIGETFESIDVGRFRSLRD